MKPPTWGESIHRLHNLKKIAVLREQWYKELSEAVAREMKVFLETKSPLYELMKQRRRGKSRLPFRLVPHETSYHSSFRVLPYDRS